MSKRCSLCLSSSCVTEFRLLSKFFIKPDIESIRSGITIHIITANINTTPTIVITRLIPLRVFSFFKNFTLQDIFSKTRDKASMGTLSITAIMQPKNIGLIMSKNLPIPPNIFSTLSAIERLTAITIPNTIIFLIFSFLSIKYELLYINNRM